MYKLTYFDSAGLTEPIRYIFALAKAKFEDDRIPRDENYPFLQKEIKDKMPWGKVPVLSYDGKIILAQSAPILRYVSKEFGFMGSTHLEEAKCDEIIDATLDFSHEWRPLFVEKDKTKRMELFEIIKKSFEIYLGKIDKIIEENGGEWLVGDNLSCADVHAAHFIRMWEHMFGIAFKDNYKFVTKLMNKVYDMEEIKAWNEKSPFYCPTISDFVKDW